MASAKVEIEVVHKTKVYKTVSEQIQRMIRDGLMKAGDWLPPERELAEMFNVSRTSLRDAIRNLEQLGLVEPRHGEGTVVRDRDEIRPKPRSRGVELLGLSPQSQEDVLRHLIGEEVRADDPLGKRPHRPTVPTIGLGKGGLVVPADRDDERGVARRREVEPHNELRVTRRA